MTTPPETRYQTVRQMAAADVGGESVVLHLESGRYFGLNPVAAAVLEWLAEPLTLEELTARLVDRYMVDAERARQDLTQLLAALRQRKLIEVIG